MTEKNKKILSYLLFTLIILIVFGFLSWFGQYEAFQGFVAKIENSSFDLRQAIISKYKKPNKDIVIIAVDNTSYEYIMDKIGFWPISRLAWANTINALESVNPKLIIFDMLFLKSNLLDKKSDDAFTSAVAQYNNVYLSMNFDNYPPEIRKQPRIGEKFRLKVTSGGLTNNEYITYYNARTVMPQLMLATKNVGAVNATRDDDGVIRNIAPIFKYRKNYYPNMTFLAALDYLNLDAVSVKNNAVILDEKHVIPLDKTKRAIINWYPKLDNEKSAYKIIPFYQITDAILNNDIEFIKENFSDKIVYIGTTATSLGDVKTSPIDSHVSGVEMHAAFFNNIIDNNFIKKLPLECDFLIAIIVSVIIGCCILKTSSVIKSLLILIVTLIIYYTCATMVMHFCNLWIGVVAPTIIIISAFISVLGGKYFIKSRDYEKTYKLSVTDGLTELYNHRYFQEQMISNINSFRRYNSIFSLILIDIDFFKKFNDTYGHQSGDAVLRQVAGIIKKNIRTSDVACRYGGEEMSIILTNTNKKDAISTANKICIAIRSHKFEVANGQKVNVTISAGVATAGENGENPQDMIEYSDKCLYKAKESGRNQVVYEV